MNTNELIAEARRIAALSPNSDAGKCFTELVSALEQVTAERDEAWRVAGEQTRMERDRAERAESERDALAAVVKHVGHVNAQSVDYERFSRVRYALMEAPSVALDHVKAEALREAADGFRLYEDCDSQAVLMVTVENYLNDRADRIEKGESNDQ